LNDGQISILCTGGVGTLSYNIQPGGVINTSGNFNSLAGNIYTIVVTDATNCTYVTTTTIVNPPALAFTSVNSNNVLCNGDSTASINIFANGGTGTYSFSINPIPSSNTSGTFNNLPINTYTIEVTDANNCSIISVVNISEPPPLFGNVLSTQNVTCFGGNNGALTVSALGGTSPYLYNLLPGTSFNSTGIFSGIFSNTYTVQITDSNLCTYLISPIIITQPPPVQWTSVVHQDIECYGLNNGSITVSASGGTGSISYSILPNIGLQTTAGNFTLITANTYTVIATDALSCTTTTIVTVLENPEIIISQIDFFPPTCNGDQNGSIIATAIGGVPPLSYQLNGGSSTSVANFTNLQADNYFINVTDALGCKKDTLVTLLEPDPVVASAIDITALSCTDVKNGTVKLYGKGGTGQLTYYMTPGLHINKTGLFTNLTAGIYKFTIKDSLGCKYDSSINMGLSSNALQVSISKKDNGCFGSGNEGWARAEVTGGEPPMSYVWSTNPPSYTSLIENLFFGYYFVDVTDANGCKVKDTVYIEPGNCCEQVFIPNAFSPNGDGNNDVFKVTTTAGIELLQFAIYDRWGNRVWSSIDYRASWDGTYNRKEENMDTFYYIFHYICLTDKQKYMRKGDIMLVR
jgi:gliding motility-associated-like protein